MGLCPTFGRDAAPPGSTAVAWFRRSTDAAGNVAADSVPVGHCVSEGHGQGAHLPCLSHQRSVRDAADKVRAGKRWTVVQRKPPAQSAAATTQARSRPSPQTPIHPGNDTSFCSGLLRSALAVTHRLGTWTTWCGASRCGESRSSPQAPDQDVRDVVGGLQLSLVDDFLKQSRWLVPCPFGFIERGCKRAPARLVQDLIGVVGKSRAHGLGVP